MVEAALKLAKDLNFPRLLLYALAAAMGIGLFTIWEQRYEMFTELKQSTYAMGSIVVGVVMIVMASVTALFVRMSEMRAKDVHDQLNLRIQSAERHSANQDIEIARLRMETRVDRERFEESLAREKESCDQRIAALAQTLRFHGIQDRRDNHGQ